MMIYLQEKSMKYTEWGAATEGSLLRREMDVNEAVPCDRNRFLVGISNFEKFESLHVFFSLHIVATDCFQVRKPKTFIILRMVIF